VVMNSLEQTYYSLGIIVLCILVKSEITVATSWHQTDKMVQRVVCTFTDDNRGTI